MATNKQKERYRQLMWENRMQLALIVGIFMLAIGLIVTVACYIGAKSAQRDSESTQPVVSESVLSSPGDLLPLSPTDSPSDIEVSSEVTSEVSSEISSEVSSKADSKPSREGTYSRTKVKKADAATLIIESDGSDGFSFSLTLPGGKLTGEAKYKDTKTAKYKSGGATLTFSFASGSVSLSHSGKAEVFGSASPDGKYTAAKPVYIEEQAAKSSYDADVRSSSKVKKALKSTLPAEDYDTVMLILKQGEYPALAASEADYDKDGRAIFVDRELDCVKYCAFLSGEGEVILICSSDGKIYCALNDYSEMRYYSNDPDRKDKAPKAIVSTAKAYGLELRYS